jgi:aspartate--ammonia ligase
MMKKQLFSKKYLSEPLVNEKRVQLLKAHFGETLMKRLNLHFVSSPLAVSSGKGINDDLTGMEKPVYFFPKAYPNQRLEIIQSLAKWKRLKLDEYDVPVHQGIVTNMSAIRPDEVVSPIHSIFVDQWDWEMRIVEKDRHLDFLQSVVEQIYASIKETEVFVVNQFNSIRSFLPDKITFIHAEDLQYRYPKLSPKERECIIAKDYGAVFIIGVGYPLADGVPHDLRAPDYDDWSTQTKNGYRGLNGDIIVWNPVLNNAFELSSMGIRVNRETMIRQLKITKTEMRKGLFFHAKVMDETLPYSIGGGIGQSRLAMLLLGKKNISEVQAGI